MSKRYWIIGSFVTLSLFGLLLFTLPQGESAAFAQNIEATLTAAKLQVVVEVALANLRTEPRTDAKKVTQVPRNTRLKVLGITTYNTQLWYLVQIEGDEKAWISDSISHVDGDAKLLPTIDLTAFYAPTATPTNTPTNTPTATLTSTPTNTPTVTSSPTATATNTSTSTSTDTPTNTATITSSPTLTATLTPLPTSTPRPSATPVPASKTPKPSATSTKAVTPTQNAQQTSTLRPTNTPKPAATKTSTPTATKTK